MVVPPLERARSKSQIPQRLAALINPIKKRKGDARQYSRRQNIMFNKTVPVACIVAAATVSVWMALNLTGVLPKDVTGPRAGNIKTSATTAAKQLPSDALPSEAQLPQTPPPITTPPTKPLPLSPPFTEPPAQEATLPTIITKPSLPEASTPPGLNEPNIDPPYNELCTEAPIPTAPDDTTSEAKPPAPTESKASICSHPTRSIHRTEPTCTSAGQEIQYCQDCGITLDEVILPALGHSLGKCISVSAPWEGEPGTKVTRCQSCDYAIWERYECQHEDIQNETIYPTVTESGIQRSRCVDCNLILSETVLSKVPSVDLSAYPPLDPFYFLDDALANICHRIVSYITAIYNQDKTPSTVPVQLSGEYHLTWAQIQQIDDALRMYFGNYEMIHELVLYQCSYLQNNSYRVILYVNEDIAMRLEADRQLCLEEIRKIFSTLPVVDTKELLSLAFNAISDKAQYNNTDSSAVSVFTKGTGSCNALALIFREMCLQIGVPCDMVVGYTASGGYHAWNRVQLENGEYRYYDLAFWESGKRQKYRGGTMPIHCPKAYNKYLHDARTYGEDETSKSFNAA